MFARFPGKVGIDDLLRALLVGAGFVHKYLHMKSVPGQRRAKQMNEPLPHPDIDVWLRNLPKVSLHCHLEGTLSPRSYRLLTQKYAVDLGERSLLHDDELYRFATFHEFLLRFRDICGVLREPADFALLAQEYATDAVNDGVVAAEIFVSPAAWLRMHPAIDVRATFEAIATALHTERRRSGIRVTMICDITRNFGPDVAVQTVEIAAAMRDLGVIGIGLGGDEVQFPAELFRDAFSAARHAGLRCVAHAGEVAGAQSVRAAVEVLGAERIGHGVRALEDASVMRMLARRHITVEQAPHSNACTGAVIGEHPMRHFVEAGVPVALDADDPAIFGKSLLQEYRDAGTRYGLQFLLDRAYDAVAGSFAEPSEKRAVFATLDQYAHAPFPEFPSLGAKR